MWDWFDQSLDEIVDRGTPGISGCAWQREMESCGICLEPCAETGPHSPVELKCGHKLGRECMIAWVEIQQLCPFCRRIVRREEVYEPGTRIPDLSDKVRSIISSAHEVLNAADPVIDSATEDVNRLRSVVATTRTRGAKRIRVRDDARAEVDRLAREFMGIWEPLIPTVYAMDSVRYIEYSHMTELEAVVAEYTEARIRLWSVIERLNGGQDAAVRLGKHLRTVRWEGRRRIVKKSTSIRH